MENKKQIRIWEPLIIGVAAAIGLIAGYNINFNNQDYNLLEFSDLTEQEFVAKDGRIEEILRFVETNYVDSLDQEIISIDAIRHIMKQLDPHSAYISADELNAHNERMDGEYRGIGIETIKLKDTFYITRITDNSPAQIADLKIGDAILSLDNSQVSGTNTSFQYIRDLLKENTKEELTISVSHVYSDSIFDKKVGPTTNNRSFSKHMLSYR